MSDKWSRFIADSKLKHMNEGAGTQRAGCFDLGKILEDLFFSVQRTVFSSIFERKRDVPEAGKKLFAVSHKQRNTTNDSDRLGKYLEKFGLSFQNITKTLILALY